MLASLMERILLNDRTHMISIQIYHHVPNSKNKLSEELYVMERNPYFFGVDEAGNQLPYWDGVNHRLYETADVFNLWIVNGEIDFQARGVDSAQYTLYKENEANGDYKVVVGVSASHVAIQLNLATQTTSCASSSTPGCAHRPVIRHRPQLSTN
jgi:hypothetical protein